MIMDIQTRGGSFTRRPSDTCCVSYWHIPSGADYDRAQARKAFFSDRTEADKLAAKYHMPPETAFVVSLEKGTES